ncbi:MAG: ATP-binding protein, partial [Actinomycetes bacterium]
RTTLLATAVVALALLVGATALLLVLQRSLARSGDDASRARVQDLAALASAGVLPPLLRVPAEDDVAQAVGGGGEVVAASASLRGVGPLVPDAPTGEPRATTVEGVPDGAEREAYRVWSVRADTPEGPVTVSVGRSLETVRDTLATVQVLLALGLPPLLGLLAYTTWVVVGRALRPVESIRAEVADVTGRALDRRVPVPPADDEVGRLARTMNAMLDRLEEASARQRRFVADASHELQGPLASLRAQLEVALAHPEATDWPATARALLADGARLERLVRDLLLLAREDEAPAPLAPVLVDLDDVVLEEAARVRTTAPVPVLTHEVSAAPVRGEREALARLVRNLLDNATRHAASTVRVGLAVQDGTAILTVADDGLGVPASDRDRIFDRFVRLEDARSRGGSVPAASSPGAGGTGLGLALVRAVADRHGGSVRVEDAAPGARFVVHVPADTAPDSVRDAAQRRPGGSGASRSATTTP